MFRVEGLGLRGLCLARVADGLASFGVVRSQQTPDS